MECCDDKCMIFCNCFTYTLYILLIPVKFLCKLITNYFARPYSFCFIIDFLLLMTPALLLVVILIQYSEFINQYGGFSIIFYYIFTTLIINFILVFHIYDIYGKHKLDDSADNYNFRTFTKFVCKYLFKNSIVGYIGILFILESCVTIICIHHLLSEKTKYIKSKPILYDSLVFSAYLNLVFTLMHVIIYIVLYLFIICKLNKSCLCKVIVDYRKGKDHCGIENDDNEKGSYSDKPQSFQNLGLECCLFIGVYDYKKELKMKKDNQVLENI